MRIFHKQDRCNLAVCSRDATKNNSHDHVLCNGTFCKFPFLLEQASAISKMRFCQDRHGPRVQLSGLDSFRGVHRAILNEGARRDSCMERACFTLLRSIIALREHS